MEALRIYKWELAVRVYIIRHGKFCKKGEYGNIKRLGDKAKERKYFV